MAAAAGGGRRARVVALLAESRRARGVCTLELESPSGKHRQGLHSLSVPSQVHHEVSGFLVLRWAVHGVQYSLGGGPRL